MKNASPDPRQILQSLLDSSGKVSLPATAEELELARSLARQVESASAAQVESLPEPLALAVLEASVRSRQVALAEALAGSSKKGLAKAAKKALYQLRSAGVAVAPKQAESSPSPAGPTTVAEVLPCLASAITGTGEQALLLVRPIRGGGLESFEVVITDEAGILSLQRGETGRSDYRKLLRELKGEPGAPREVQRETASALLGEAAAVNLATRTPFPPGAEDALRAFEARPREPAPLPLPEPDDERLAARGHTLHDEPELAPWLPSEPQLRIFAERMDEVTSSPLQLSEAQRAEQLNQKILATAHEFFTPPMRKLYARRLWRMAEYFEGTGRSEPARLARAEARQLFHTTSPSRFAEYLFEKVWLLTERARAGQPLPKPGERLDEAAEKKTPGGLILP